MAPPLRAHQVVDLLCPLRNHLLLAVGDAEVVPERAAPRFADRFDAVGEMLAVAIVEDRGFALRRHEAIARGIVHRPDRHVAGAGRVADVDRVVEQDAGVVARAQFLLHAAEAIEAQPRHVDVVAVVDQPERRLAPRPALQVDRWGCEVIHGDSRFLRRTRTVPGRQVISGPADQLRAVSAATTSRGGVEDVGVGHVEGEAQAVADVAAARGRRSSP